MATTGSGERTIGLASLGGHPTIHHFDYQVMSPGLYSLVFGPVTLMLDFNEQEVTAVAVVTNHEDRYAPCDPEEDYIVAKVPRFKATQEIYDAGGKDE